MDAVLMQVNQSTGADMDPTNLTAAADGKGRKSFSSKDRVPIEIGVGDFAVLSSAGIPYFGGFLLGFLHSTASVRLLRLLECCFLRLAAHVSFGSSFLVWQLFHRLTAHSAWHAPPPYIRWLLSVWKVKRVIAAEKTLFWKQIRINIV
jgi:hypothetical protein